MSQISSPQQMPSFESLDSSQLQKPPAPLAPELSIYSSAGITRWRFTQARSSSLDNAAWNCSFNCSPAGPRGASRLGSVGLVMPPATQTEDLQVYSFSIVTMWFLPLVFVASTPTWTLLRYFYPKSNLAAVEVISSTLAIIIQLPRASW